MGKEACIKYMFKVLCVHIFTWFFSYLCQHHNFTENIPMIGRKKTTVLFICIWSKSPSSETMWWKNQWRLFNVQHSDCMEVKKGPIIKKLLSTSCWKFTYSLETLLWLSSNFNLNGFNSENLRNLDKVCVSIEWILKNKQGFCDCTSWNSTDTQ